jgi:hypothetical protein
LAYSITGTSLFYAGGGAGGTYINTTVGVGGSGVGGNGASSNVANATRGTDGRGGGGGGGGHWNTGSAPGANGGSGTVIVSYPVITGFSTLATATTDSNFNFQISATSNIRLTQPTEWHYLTTDTTASSLALTASNAGTFYNFTSNALSLLNVPSLTSADRGMWWQLSNSTVSNMVFTVSGATGLPSNYALMPFASATLYWNGASNRILAPYTGIASVIETSGTSLTLAPSNYNSLFYLTNGGFNAVTLPATTATSNGGNYWTLRNATNNYLSIALTNTLSLTTPLVIPPLNATTFAISRVTSNTILLF